MATEEALQRISMPVASDLSAKQFLFVKLDSSGNAVVAGDGEAASGVLQDKPDGSSVATAGMVGIAGVTMITYGGNVTAGDYLTSDTNGKAVKAGTGDYINGKAMVSGASGDVGSALLSVPAVAKFS